MCVRVCAFVRLLFSCAQVEVRTEVEKVCVILGPLAGGCRDFINEYFDQIWKAVFEQIVRYYVYPVCRCECFFFVGVKFT